MASLEQWALVGQHLDTGIEACEEPRDPGGSDAFGKPAFESRDGRLRQSASSGEGALAQAALPAELPKHLAERLQGLPCWLVEPADRT